MKKGKFIVIEGTDGSGKGTQIALLDLKLRKEKIPFEITNFPQYGKPSAFFVEKYLRGEYGSADEIGPEKASYFYALDRFDKSFEMKKWLDEGKNIISNRYTTSNMGHQAGKILEKTKRTNFLNWLSDLEYKILGIPKPDKVIFLFVPPLMNKKLIGRKPNRAYIKGAKDIHENDLNHLNKASEAYLEVAKKFKWTVINCAPDGVMLSRDVIHKMIWEKVAPVFKLKI
jgi:dTMP kinase